jgi:drug/metabolite transporter (DMT)-like permease
VDVDLSLDCASTLLAALLIGTGFVLQQHAAEVKPDSRFLSIRLITDLLRKPRWLAGIVCMVLGQVLAAWSIGHLELSLVEPLLTTNLIFALLLAVPLSGQSFQLREVAGAVILCAGVGLLSASRFVTPIGLSFGSFSHWPAAAAIAWMAAILVHVGRRRAGRLRAALTGTAAGLVFGIQDALTRQMLEALQGNSWSVLFSTWSAYALLGSGAVGIWLMQNAFSAGPLQASLPAISAGEPLVGIFLGVLVFGDRIQVSPGMLAIQAGGIAAMLVGVITVASAPALSQLREQASKLRSAVTPHAGQPLGGTPAEAAQDEAAPGEAAHDKVSSDKAAPGDAAREGAARGDVARDKAPHREAAQDRAAPGGAAQDGGSEGGAQDSAARRRAPRSSPNGATGTPEARPARSSSSRKKTPLQVRTRQYPSVSAVGRRLISQDSTGIRRKIGPTDP